ncbi:helix-turn-helix domain-containing protein [Paenibacillus sp. y28]|uniref:helix-turn-helix domain-containing protein n=1 Tax=Paenibacillus sp. y28 TaxID=3129110 RepID=UPI003017572A
MERREDRSGFLQGTMLELKDVRLVTGTPGWRWEHQTRTSYTFIMAVKFKGDLLINGAPVPLSGKSALVLPPGMKVEASHPPGQEMKMYRIAFDLFRMTERTAQRRIYERETAFPAPGIVRKAPYRLQRLAEALAAAYASGKPGPGGGARQEQLLQELVHELLQQQAGDALPPKSSDQSLQLTLRYIQDAYQSEIKLDKLAEIAGMHPSYYSQLFKQKMGKNPMEYVTQLRMNKAKELLLEGALPIREIAREAGYRDEFYFSRRFKETGGCAPTMYTKQHRPGIVSLSYPYTDHLLTLGITPLAAQLHPALPQVTKPLHLPFHASEPWEMSRQTFLDLKPDMMLCKENVLKKAREHVPDIAPLVTIPWTQTDMFGHLQHIAAVVDRRRAAEEWLGRHEQRAEQARKRVKQIIGSGSVTICRIVNGTIRIYSERNIGHVFYRSLQLAPSERLQLELQKHRTATSLNWISVAPEELALYESDILLLVLPSKQDTGLMLQELSTNPLWQRHPAVQRKRYYLLEWEQWMVYAPYSIDRQLDAAVSLLTDSAHRRII